MPKTFDELVEFRARALYAWWPDGVVHRSIPRPDWDDVIETSKALWRQIARATLIAEYKAGIVPCPVEATEEMCRSAVRGGRADQGIKRRVSRAIAATPFKPEAEDV